jgi:hypothetical protein
VSHHAALLGLLQAAPPDVFNQYAVADPALDQLEAAVWRRENLERYLATFGGARYLLIGEAAGFRAGRFTGVPFVDETQLVGERVLEWAGTARGYRRASRLDRPLLREASATVVRGAIDGRRDVALWNVVPWHPPGKRGPLSNALPSRAAQRAGLTVLAYVLDFVWPEARPVAVGRVAERALRELGLSVPRLRHPAQGGAAEFRSGLGRLLLA